MIFGLICPVFPDIGHIAHAVIINSRSTGASFIELLLRARRKLLIVRKWMGWTRIPHGPCFEGLTAWQWTDILTSQCGLARTHTPILRPREWENNESKNLSWDCIYCYGLCVVFDTVCKPIKVTLCSTLKQISAHFCPSDVTLKKQNEKLLFEIHQYILAWQYFAATNWLKRFFRI